MKEGTKLQGEMTEDTYQLFDVFLGHGPSMIDHGSSPESHQLVSADGRQREIRNHRVACI